MLYKTNDGKIRDENLQYDIKREPEKILALSQVNMINMNTLQANKYYHLIKVE